MASETSQRGLREICQTILEDSLGNIVHDILLERHRDHKLMLATLDPDTRLSHCDRCNLPRLLEPPLAPSVRGVSSDPPAETVYCDRKPWCRKPGFDIYGNPFLKADISGRPPTKKEREAAKNKKDGNGEGTPASNEGGDAINGTAPPSPSPDRGNNKESKLEKGEKKANKIDEKLKKGEYIPWQTCPNANCKRSLLITRFAKHLEQCLGLSGRAASRNAMAKMNGNTPAGSPAPEDDEGVKKRALKKGALGSKLKHKTNGKATSDKPRLSENGKRRQDEMLVGEEVEENDVVHVKKRQKLERVGSTASLASSSAPGLEKVESADGSFVDEGDPDGEAVSVVDD